MLSVILIWSYILITVYLIGRGMILLARKCGIISDSYSPKEPVPYILAGLVAVTVYAQIWSLFAGVGLYANVVLCFIAAGAFFALKQTGDNMLPYPGVHNFGSLRTALITATVLFLLMAYGTSHGLMHYDTGLYHAQAIHWIEEYGSVPGLANIHTRLGYNSSAFVLNALYSFSFISGRSYHVTAGFTALLLAWECFITPLILKPRVLSVSNMVRAMGVYYLLMIYDEMVSPASDYYMVCLAFVLVIRWTQSVPEDCGSDPDLSGEINDRDNSRIDKYCLLTFLACFILTVKLSGAMLILLAIWPVILILKRGRIETDPFKNTEKTEVPGPRIIKCIIAGACIIAPYLIRNVILSGWLLYPSTMFGFLSPDWQVPADIALYDYKEIQVYGRGFTDVSLYDEPVTYWIRDWFGGQSSTDKLLIIAAMVGVLVFVVQCSVMVIRRPSSFDASADGAKDSSGAAPEAEDRAGIIVVSAVMIICFGFWLFTSPLMRYGCLFVYLTAALTWGGLLNTVVYNPRDTARMIYTLTIVVVSAIALYKGFMWSIETIRGNRADTWVLQQDYDPFETFSYKISNEAGTETITLYAPKEGDRTGYYDFPSTPWEMSGQVKLRGEDIKDGFIHQ